MDTVCENDDLLDEHRIQQEDGTIFCGFQFSGNTKKNKTLALRKFALLAFCNDNLSKSHPKMDYSEDSPLTPFLFRQRV